MRLAGWSLLVIAAAASGGCATIVHGAHQTVTIVSDPPGARVIVLSTPEGKAPIVKSKPLTTPVQIDLLRREKDLTLRFEMDECAPVEVRLKRGASGWTAGNLIYANPMSMQGMTDPASQYPFQLAMMIPLTFGIDFASGAAYTLPKTIEARLCGK